MTIETPRTIARDGGWLAHTPAAMRILRQPYRHHVVEGRASLDHYVLPQAAAAYTTTKLGLGVAEGTIIWVHNINAGSHDVRVRNADSTFSANVAANSSSAFVLLSGATAAGTWELLIQDAENARGPVQPDGFNFRLTITRSQNNVNVLQAAVAAGYDGTEPALVRVHIKPGVVIGSSSIAAPAFSFGGDSPISGVNWDSGSLIFLTNEGVISGRGGAAGSGGIGGTGASTGTTGEAGGIGLRAAISVAISNLGVIQGGGGGGGGGNGSAGTPGLHGGGGGGGAGADVNAAGVISGGAGGFAGTGAQKGVAGSLFSFGERGVGSLVTPDVGGRGGHGGGPATAGDPGKTLNNAGDGSAGGAAGPAISRDPGATVTFLVAGTVTGSTLVV